MTRESHPLVALLRDAAHGRFPPADGAIRVLPRAPGRADAVVAFTAHHVVAANVAPDRIRGHLAPGDLGAPMRARFLAWLGDELGAESGYVHVVLARAGSAARGRATDLVRADHPPEHPRVARALRYRDEVSVYTDPKRSGLLILGRGVAGRREVSLEIEPEHQGAGLGRRMLRAALRLLPEREPLFAQVPAGNVRSLRAFLAAGFRPVCAEVLFLRR